MRKFLAQFQDVLVIAGMLKEAPTETTPLQKELDHVGWLLGIIR